MGRRLATDEDHTRAAAGLKQPWLARSACADRAEVMNPPTRNLHALWAARDVCGMCPVLADCRAWALGLDERTDPGGVLGAMTEAERTRARGRQRRAEGMSADPGFKVCRRCRQEKVLIFFFADRLNADGRNSYCKSCNTEMSLAARSRREGA